MINILEKIDTEIARLQMARAALAGAGKITQRVSRRAKEALGISKETVEVTQSTPKKRKMSAAGRARIAAAQKARWAKVKKAVKTPTSVKKTAAKKSSPSVKRTTSKKQVVSRAN